MQKILEEIKSVQGVAGVLVWDKRALKSFQLLPASFANAVVKSTCSKLIKVAQSLKPPAELKLLYEAGNAILIHRTNLVLLILGRSDLNPSLLDLVLNSSLLRLDKILASRQTEIADSPPLEQKKVNQLIEATNLLSRFISDKIGPYRTTQNLRQVKEKLIGAHPFLANLFVDNNANISVIKGKEGLWSGEVVLAFAKWAANLEKLSFKKGDALDLKKITSSLEESLEEMGFYFVFQNVAENI